ncbi:MAG: hypothetical protein MUQ10_02340, partial [Anaerolineae bacterium]|nr:hypothetical protein [Anaerolineae bacterium]
GVDEQYHLVHDMISTSVLGHEKRFGVKARTVRQHAVRWRGYVDAARDLADLGVEMDFNYVSVAPFSATYMTGSGRPMRMIDECGEILDIFQQSTLYSEDLMLEPNFVFSLKWSTERALRHVGEMLSENLARYYTPIGLNSHPVSFVAYSRAFVEGVLDMALQRNVPIVTAEAWNDFTRARDGTSISNVVPHTSGFTCMLTVPDSASPLTLCWPLHDGDVVSFSVDGAAQQSVEAELWTRRLAMLELTLAAGEHTVDVNFAAPAE